MAQDYGNSYPASQDKKQTGYQPPSHSTSKQSGSYPGSYPSGYQHQKQPAGYGGGYAPPNPYGTPNSYGAPNPYGQYGHNQWKHYDYCKPDYETYPGNSKYHLRYLESGKEQQHLYTK